MPIAPSGPTQKTSIWFGMRAITVIGEPGPAAPGGVIANGAWSFQLALRSRGLGSVMATALAHKASRVREVLGLPEDWLPITLLPVAYTRGLEFRPAARADLSQVAFWNGSTERAGSR